MGLLGADPGPRETSEREAEVVRRPGESADEDAAGIRAAWAHPRVAEAADLAARLHGGVRRSGGGRTGGPGGSARAEQGRGAGDRERAARGRPHSSLSQKRAKRYHWVG